MPKFSTVLKCSSPIYFIDFFPQVNLEKTAVGGSKNINSANWKKTLPLLSDLSGVQIYSLSRLLAMNLTLVTADVVGGWGARRGNKAVRVHPLIAGKRYDSVFKCHNSFKMWFILPPHSVHLIKMVSLVQSLV